jgi:hypothetical protein
MVVPAAVGADDAGHDAQRLDIEPQLPDRRAHQRSDQHQIAATLTSRQSRKASKLTDVDPMVPEALNRSGVRPAVQREHHDAAPLPDERIGNRRWQAAAAANDGNRIGGFRSCGTGNRS